VFFMAVSYVFSGQGSHQQGMGRDLFPRYPYLLSQADHLLGYSVSELCLNASTERLTDTRFTQCSMYVVCALSYVDQVRRNAIIPDLLAGHSLGEYTALFAAGAFDFLTGLEIVHRRATLMAEAGPGAMAAVIGLAEDEVRDALDRGRAHAVDVANLNTPTQVVISGRKQDMAAAVTLLKPVATAVVPLSVSGAFHSRHMASAAEQFGAYLAQFRFAALKIPVVANTTGRPHTDAELARELQRQVTSPVRWTDTVHHLLDHTDEIREIGPGQVLTGLTRQITAQRDAAPVEARR
jgi:malonyl CoA-acyl carrier protein transacylase